MKGGVFTVEFYLRVQAMGDVARFSKDTGTTNNKQQTNKISLKFYLTLTRNRFSKLTAFASNTKFGEVAIASSFSIVKYFNVQATAH